MEAVDSKREPWSFLNGHRLPDNNVMIVVSEYQQQHLNDEVLNYATPSHPACNTILAYTWPRKKSQTNIGCLDLTSQCIGVVE